MKSTAKISINQTLAYLAMLLFIGAYIYEKPLLGTTSAVIFAYSAFVVLTLYAISSISRLIFDTPSLILYNSFFVVTFIMWFYHRYNGFVETTEIDKAYISTFVLITVPFLVKISRKILEKANYLINLYLFILFINSIIIFFQITISLVLGVTIHILPWLAHGTRLSGLFMEPSYFGQICVPIAFLPSEFIEKEKKKIVAITFGLILSFSLFAIFSAILIVVRFYFRAKSSLLLVLLTILSVLIIFIIITLLFLFTNTFSYGPLERITMFITVIKEKDLSTDYSLFYRFFSGYYILRYEKFSMYVKGYGPGDGKVIAKNYKGDVFRNLILNWPFISGFTSTILGYGLIFSIFLFLYLAMHLNLMHLAIILTTMLFDAKPIFSPYMIFMVFIFSIYSYLRDDNSSKKRTTLQIANVELNNP